MTPLHVAVLNQHADVVNCFIRHADDASRGAVGGRIVMATDFNINDSEGKGTDGFFLFTQVSISPLFPIWYNFSTFC